MTPSDRDIERLAQIPDPFPSEGSAPPLRLPMPSRSPTRSHVRARRWAALALALFWNGAWLLFEHRADLGGLAAWSLAVGVTIPLAAGALALVAVVRRGPQGLGAPPRLLGALAIAAPALFVVGTGLSAAPDAADAAFWRPALGCLGATAALAIAPWILGVWAYRRAFVASSASRTAALGVACGAMAAATMSIACSNGSRLHLLVGHGAMMIVLGLSGALLARKLALA